MGKKYKVGYGKPPIETQYKKNQSGNPKGRPKGSTKSSIFEKLDKELRKKITIKENGKLIKITKIEAYFKRLINGALNNEGRSISAILKILPLLETYREQISVSSGPQTIVQFIDDIPD